MFKRVIFSQLKSYSLIKRIDFKLLNLNVNYSSSEISNNLPEKKRLKLPSRPLDWDNQELTQVIESKDEFKYVEKILPNDLVPDPPKHESYPTPSGWRPVNPEKSSKLPYYILRTRFHNYPIYLLEREGGSRKLVKIKYIEGNIWEFDRDLRKYIENCLEKYENKKLNVYSQVNEVQRQILVKGHYQEYINKFFIECGF